jgi:hypothetical protein
MGPLTRIVERREALVARSACYRARLARDMQPFARTLAGADRVIAALRQVSPWVARIMPVYYFFRRLRKR